MQHIWKASYSKLGNQTVRNYGYSECTICGSAVKSHKNQDKKTECEAKLTNNN